MDILKVHIRDIPDYPKPGILFKDITPLLKVPTAFQAAIDALVNAHRERQIDLICGAESRGFLFGTPMAIQMGSGFVPVRKPGKLPYHAIREDYTLEYGTSTIEMHADAVQPGQRVLIVDDLLATGGTARAAANLIEKLGGEVVGYAFVIELAALGGRERLSNAPVMSLLEY